MSDIELLRRRWAPELRRRTAAVLTPSADDGLLAAPEIEALPSWLLVPLYLQKAWEATPDEDLSEVLWGQYALFLYIRIQDDLLDRERDDLRLVFVADRFLLESLASFQQADLLPVYQSCLRETVDAILEVRQLESLPGQFSAQHLDLHARVSAIFKMAATAVCVSHGRTTDMGWIAPLFDCLAVFSQICDDAQDVVEDLEADRFTWVGNTLGQRPWDPERQAIVVRELRRLAAKAAATVPASAPSPIHDLVTALSRRADALETGWHESSVRHVFAAVL